MMLHKRGKEGRRIHKFWVRIIIFGGESNNLKFESDGPN